MCILFQSCALLKYKLKYYFYLQKNVWLDFAGWNMRQQSFNSKPRYFSLWPVGCVNKMVYNAYHSFLTINSIALRTQQPKFFVSKLWYNRVHKVQHDVCFCSSTKNRFRFLVCKTTEQLNILAVLNFRFHHHHSSCHIFSFVVYVTLQHTYYDWL